MTACGGLRLLFENPLPESSSLIDSLTSWSQTKIKPKPIKDATFTEIFGELHFKETAESLPNSSPPSSDRSPWFDSSSASRKRSLSWDSKSTESLQLCTEGLGSESSDEVENLNDFSADWRSDEMGGSVGNKISNGCLKKCSNERLRRSDRKFPPPISSIGSNGKPLVSFKSYREGGRFVLREIKIPTQEFLRASREDGRLKLHFIHPETEIPEDEEDEGEEGEETRLA